MNVALGYLPRTARSDGRDRFRFSCVSRRWLCRRRLGLKALAVGTALVPVALVGLGGCAGTSVTAEQAARDGVTQVGDLLRPARGKPELPELQYLCE